MADTSAGTPIAVIAASLRRERERVGLSLSELAKRAGIAKSSLSQLEAATGNPSVETIWALSVALGVPFSRLVEAPRQVVRVIRAGEGPVMHAERATYTATLLASSPPHARRDVYRIQAEPGQPREADDDVPRVVLMDLEEVPIVHHRMDHIEHVVGLRR